MLRRYTEEVIRKRDLGEADDVLEVKNWEFISCRLRVLMGFPIDAEFNHPTGWRLVYGIIYNLFLLYLFSRSDEQQICADPHLSSHIFSTSSTLGL